MKPIIPLAILLATTATFITIADAALIDQARKLGDTTTAIAEISPPTGNHQQILDKNGSPIGYLKPPTSNPYEQYSPPAYVENAFIEAEDKTFWTNTGIDLSATIRAASQDLMKRHAHPIGASTITQQLAKIMLLNGDTSTLSRKIDQIILAERITRAIPKQTILHSWLNRIYLGHGATGLTDAAQIYFSTTPDKLTLDQAATLAVMPRNPAMTDPQKHQKDNQSRRNLLLSRMLSDGLITTDQYNNAASTQTITHPGKKESINTSVATNGIGWPLDLIRTQTANSQSQEIQSTIDQTLQDISQITIQINLMSLQDKISGWTGPVPQDPAAHTPDEQLRSAQASLTSTNLYPDWATPCIITQTTPTTLCRTYTGKKYTLTTRSWTWASRQRTLNQIRKLRSGDIIVAGQPGESSPAILCNPTTLDASLTIIDSESGAIRAIVGGKRWIPGAYNRATQSLRPPGSTIKPFIYLSAFENGFTKDSPVFDIPTSIALDKTTIWKPNDDDTPYQTAIPIHQALAESRNIPVARLTQQLGLDTLSKTLSRAGLYPKITNPAEALGTLETTTLALASAYAIIANNGIRTDPHLIEAQTRYPPTQIFSKDNTAAMKDCLSEVIIPGGTAPQLEKISKEYSKKKIQIGGKTGTSSNFNDAWFAGYIGTLAIAIHVGYDQPHTMGDAGFGSTAAAPIFAAIATIMEKQSP